MTCHLLNQNSGHIQVNKSFPRAAGYDDKTDTLTYFDGVGFNHTDIWYP